MASPPTGPADSKVPWQWLFWGSLAQGLFMFGQEDGYRPHRDMKRDQVSDGSLEGRTVSNWPGPSIPLKIAIRSGLLPQTLTYSHLREDQYPYELSQRFHKLMKLSPLYCIADVVVLVREFITMCRQTKAPIRSVVSLLWLCRTGEDDDEVEERSRGQQMTPLIRILMFVLGAIPPFIKLMSARGIILVQICGCAWMLSYLILEIFALARRSLRGRQYGIEKQFSDLLDRLRRERMGSLALVTMLYETLMLAQTGFLLKEILKRSGWTPFRIWGIGTLGFLLVTVTAPGIWGCKIYSSREFGAFMISWTMTLVVWVMKGGIDCAFARAPSKDEHAFTSSTTYYKSFSLQFLFWTVLTSLTTYALVFEVLPFRITGIPTESDLCDHAGLWAGMTKARDLHELDFLLAEFDAAMQAKVAAGEIKDSYDHERRSFLTKESLDGLKSPAKATLDKQQAYGRWFRGSRGTFLSFYVFALNILIPLGMYALLYDSKSTSKPALDELG